MPSTFASPKRRLPQQQRATRRRAKFLEVAERLIARNGYDAVTMTAIAQESSASIGTLYDYFPDRQSIALALLSQYTDQANAHWELVLREVQGNTQQQFAELFVDRMLGFARAHPAYVPLIGAPIAYSRTAEARHAMRVTIAAAIQKVVPVLTAERAYLSAQIVVALMKGMLAVYKHVAAKDKTAVVEEFKRLILAHLNADRAS